MLKYSLPLFALLLLFNPSIHAQTDSIQKHDSDPFWHTTAAFPDDWAGIWKGDLEILGVEAVMHKIPMELHVAPMEDPDRWEWTIMYGAEEDTNRDIRAYELVEISANQGHYQVDEKNSILLDCYLRSGSLYSMFDVQGSLLYITYSHKGDEIWFDVMAVKMEMIESGGEGEDEDGPIPVVHSYPLAGAQRARLFRISK